MELGLLIPQLEILVLAKPNLKAYIDELKTLQGKLSIKDPKRLLEDENKIFAEIEATQICIKKQLDDPTPVLPIGTPISLYDASVGKGKLTPWTICKKVISRLISFLPNVGTVTGMAATLVLGVLQFSTASLLATPLGWGLMIGSAVLGIMVGVACVYENFTTTRRQDKKLVELSENRANLKSGNILLHALVNSTSTLTSLAKEKVLRFAPAAALPPPLPAPAVSASPAPAPYSPPASVPASTSPSLSTLPMTLSYM